jgi:hypothetical protein
MKVARNQAYLLSLVIRLLLGLDPDPQHWAVLLSWPKY